MGSLFSATGCSLPPRAPGVESASTLRSGGDKSICGTNDLQYVNSYDGRLGLPRAFVRQHQFAAAALEMTGSDTSVKVCSGTLVGPDLVLTADHCLGPDPTGTFFAFNYEYAADAATLLPITHARVTAVVEEDPTLDFALLRVEGAPGLTFGWARLALDAPPVGARLAIFQHPNGVPKEVGTGHLAALVDGFAMRYGDLDTDNGSSGGGILAADGRVVGIHTSGGCTDRGGANGGLALAGIRNSEVLTEIAERPAPLVDLERVRLVVADDVRRSLTVDPETGEVVVASDGGCEGPTEWLVSDLGDGAFSLTLPDPNGVGVGKVLIGRATGDVGLADATDGDSFDQRWQVLADGSGRVGFRTVGGSDGGRWLTPGPGSTPNSRAKLVNVAGFWTVERRR